MRTPGLLGFSFLLLAAVASGHSGPIAPSRCVFDPATITPANGAALALAPAGAGDGFHVLYDAATATGQFCPDPGAPAERCTGPAPARALAGGTLALGGFMAHMRISGDVVAGAVPMTFTAGAASSTALVALTTGLVATGGTIAEGAPIAADGSLTLVGGVTLADLPPPLGGTPLLVRLSCIATPPPDRDQFVVSTATARISGRVATNGVHLSALFRPGADLSESTATLAAPALVRVSAGGVPLATAEFPGGLQPSGRSFIGQTADGTGKLTVKLGRRSGRLTLDLASATVPGGSGSTTVTLTYQVGDLISRGSRTFRARGGTLRSS
jgi:hypothetical protein